MSKNQSNATVLRMVMLAMLVLCALVAALRVLSGQHYISDVLVALVLSGALSAAGYWL